MLLNIRSISGESFSTEVDTANVSGLQIKRKLVEQNPDLKDKRFKLYYLNKKLSDEKIVDVKSNTLISLVVSSTAVQRSERAKVTEVTPVDRPDGQHGDRKPSEHSTHLLSDILKDYEESGPIIAGPPQNRVPLDITKILPKKTQRIKKDISLPPCLQQIDDRFKELSVIVGFLYQQGLQPTLSSLQQQVQGFNADLLQTMIKFAPGVITIHNVSSLAQFSDATKGKAAAKHGALAESGLSYPMKGSDDQEETENKSESEVVVNLHITPKGRSPRSPISDRISSEPTHWKTLTGGIVYGSLAYSNVEEAMSEQSDQAVVPALIQGSRRSSHTVGPMGMQSTKAYQKGAMAREMKQNIIKWQKCFTQALVEIVKIDVDNLDLSIEEFVDRAEKCKPDPKAYSTSNENKEMTGYYKPCKDTTQMSVKRFTSHLVEKTKTSGNDSRVAYIKEIPGRKAILSNLSNSDIFSSYISRALFKVGIKRLYAHQESAVLALKSGQNVIITTPTASGKSICYNGPVLDTLTQDATATALYMFPTKALAQDQLRALGSLCSEIPSLDSDGKIGVYDGDTPPYTRELLTSQGRIIISNPDILSVTLLPNHKKFGRFLMNLKYVVLDEAHAYRGVFGSHVALVVRRLRRVLDRVYSVEPQFFLSSATIANSKSHAQNLTGIFEWKIVDKDGSPCGNKTFILWNPPYRRSFLKSQKAKENDKASTDGNDILQGKHAETTDGIDHDYYKMKAWKGRERQKRENRRAKELTKTSSRTRISPIMEMGMLLAECVQHDLKSIAFCKTRKLSELVLTYAQQALDELDSKQSESIAAYRAGYTVKDRRAIETSLFKGVLKGVAATNALELGIDVGALDVTLHLGFPGTVSSLWQQAGRAGRREQEALSIYVAFDGALDQYFMANPEKLFQAPIEHASIDYQNLQLLEQHVACAGYELPLFVDERENDAKYFGSVVKEAVRSLSKRGLIGRNPESPSDPRWFYIGKAKQGPARLMNLRAIDETVWTVVDDRTGNLVEEIEQSKAFFQVYEGAVYMQQGRKYLCTKLDMKSRIASVRRADLKYYTSIRHHSDIHVTGGQAAYPDRAILPAQASIIPYGSSAQLELAKHSINFICFQKVWQHNGQSFDSVDLNLPKIEYETVCTWIRVSDKARAIIEERGRELRAGVHGAAHALLNVLPLYIMCNVADVGVECVNSEETRWRPERLLIYDKQPGGTGIAAQVQPLFGNILRAAYDLVHQCPCVNESGCPSCIHHGECPQYNAVLDKEAALIILEHVIEAEDGYLDVLEKET